MAERCFIYVIQAMDTARQTFFKVGISKHPERRLRTIQSGCPLRCDLDRTVECISREAALAFEKFIHERLDDIRATGEWFHVTSFEDYLRLLDEIEAASRVVVTPTWRKALHG